MSLVWYPSPLPPTLHDAFSPLPVDNSTDPDHHPPFSNPTPGTGRRSPTPQTNWKNKHDLPYHLLCDKESVLIGAWGLSKNGGKSIIRSHVVVDRSGKVRAIRVCVWASLCSTRRRLRAPSRGFSHPQPTIPRADGRCSTFRGG